MSVIKELSPYRSTLLCSLIRVGLFSAAHLGTAGTAVGSHSMGLDRHHGSARTRDRRHRHSLARRLWRSIRLRYLPRLSQGSAGPCSTSRHRPQRQGLRPSIGERFQSRRPWCGQVLGPFPACEQLQGPSCSPGHQPNSLFQRTGWPLNGGVLLQPLSQRGNFVTLSADLLGLRLKAVGCICKNASSRVG